MRRGGRRLTDSRPDLETSIDCSHCDEGKAPLAEVVTVPGGVLLSYECPLCREVTTRFLDDGSGTVGPGE